MIYKVFGKVLELPKSACALLKCYVLGELVLQEVLRRFLLDEDSPLQKGKVTYEEGKIVYESSDEIDDYIVECAKSVSAIDSAVDKVNQSLTILNYDYINSIDCEQYNLAEYIEFHIENYIIRAHSIYDRTLIFINKLLQLGIDNSHIGHGLIVSNENVIRFELDKPLQALKKQFKNYHNIRNTIIHHDRYKDDEFDTISLYHKTESLLKQTSKDPLINEGVLKALTSEYLGSKTDELTENLNQIKEKLKLFLEEAVKVYGHRKSQLKT